MIVPICRFVKILRKKTCFAIKCKTGLKWLSWYKLYSEAFHRFFELVCYLNELLYG